MSSVASSRRWRAAIAAALLAGLSLAVLGLASQARLDRADFVFNNGTEVATLDPATITGVPEGRVVYMLFEGLTVKHPETLEPLPGMAESWERSPDGLRYTFHLRPDARWSNGDPVTARDFEWSWRRLLDPRTAAEYAYQLWSVRGAQSFTTMPEDRLYAADARQSTWVLERPDGTLRLGLTGFLLDGLDPGTALGVPLAAGDELEPGGVLALAGTAPVAAPLGGRVRAVNAARADSAGALAADPYEGGWLVDLEPRPNALAAARATGELLPPDRFRDEVAWPELVGIRAANDRDLEIELRAPTPYFVNLTGFYPLFPVNRRNLEEARRRWPATWEIEWLRPENIVTNGPFLVKERRINDRIRVVKNPDYWDADEVAFRTIDILAVEHYGTMLNLYLTGEVDWIDKVIPNLVPRLIRREDFRPEPYLGTYFYRVNTTRPPFDDVRVRRALALTIDRRAICEKIMKAGQVPNWSLVPHGFADYVKAEMAHAPVAPDLSDYDRAFAADCARAAELLAQAGYGTGGRDLPTIEIHYNTSEAHRDIAEVIADAWKKHLGLNVKLQNQEWKVYLDTQRTMDFDVSRSAWIGDYLDPNTFLDLFVTGGENNRTGWGDARYDALIARAAREPDEARRMELLHDAEALLMEALPILPIYTYVTQNIKRPRLGGWAENLQDDHFPKFWYWMDDEELAAKRAAYDADWELVRPGGPPEGLYSPAELRRRGAR